MIFDVWADLSRRLSDEERKAVGAALEAEVPGGGSVGARPRNATAELSFTIEARGVELALPAAMERTQAVLDRAGLALAFSVEVVLRP